MGKLKFNRGTTAQKPSLEPAEPYIDITTKQLKIGESAGELTFSPVTNDQKDALQGTSGTPSSSNKFVTNSDTRLADQRTPIDNSVTYLKLLSSLRAYLISEGYNPTSELISEHKYLSNNFAVLDANNNYHQMVEVPRKNWDSANGFAAATIDPAFIVNSTQKRLMIGKYQASTNSSGQLVTHANKVPLVSKTFDQELALAVALNNGTAITGFHQMTNPEWALLARISKNLGITVYGNNNYGRDIDDKSITFRMSYPENFAGSGDGKSYTGSGGVKTSHNGQLDGIFDLNGNIWERVTGFRIVNGEIQILPNNDGADYTKDHSTGSTAYKAVLEDGTLVAPGTAGTLKISASGNITKTTPAIVSTSKTFESVGVESDVSAASAGVELLKKLLIYPYTTGLNGDYFYYNTDGERLPRRGGGWYEGTGAGLFALNLLNDRSNAHYVIGFRLAFVV